MASNDTYAGALEVLAKQIAGMSLLADANLPFLMELLDLVQSETRSPEMAMQKAGVLPGGAPVGGPPPMGGPMVDPMLGGPPMSTPPPIPAPGAPPVITPELADMAASGLIMP